MLPFRIDSRMIKYLIINLTKEMKDHHNANFRSLKNEIETLENGKASCVNGSINL